MRQTVTGWFRTRAAPVALVVILSAALAVGSLTPVSMHSALAASAARRAVNNLLHVPAYAVLTLAWAWTLRAVGRISLPRCAFVGFGAAVLYGIAMEFGQLSVPGRYASTGDALLNAVGAAAAAGGLVLLARRRAGLRIEHSAGAGS